MNYKILVNSAVSILLLTLLSSNVYAISAEKQGNVELKAKPAKLEVNYVPNSNNVSLSLYTSGENRSIKSTSTSSSKPSGSSAPACFIWTKYGNGEQLVNSIINAKFDKAAQSGDNQVARTAKEMQDKALELQGKDLSEEEMDKLGKEDFTSLTLDNAYQIDSVIGNASLYLNAYKTMGGTLEEKDREEMISVSAFMITPNPAVSSSDWNNDNGSQGRCGNYPGANNGTIFIASPGKVTIDTDLVANSKEITDDILATKITVALSQASKGKYRADVSFLNGTEVSNPGMVPLILDDITYVWTVRTPSIEDPLSETVSLSESEFSGREQSKSKTIEHLTFNNKLIGSGLDTGPFESILSSGFSNGCSIYTKNTFKKCLEDNLFETESVDGIEPQIENEPGLVQALKSKQSSEYMRVIKSEKIHSGRPLIVDGKVNYSDISEFSKTLDLNSALGGLPDGKYIVGVSVILNGTYKLNGINNSSLTMSVPLGFASDLYIDQTDSCGILNSKFNQFNNIVVGEDNGAVSKVEKQVCTEETWKAPVAKAVIKASPDGKVTLNGSRSTGTIHEITTFKYVASTTKVCEEKGTVKDPITGVESEGCVKEVEYYDGGSIKKQVLDTKKTVYPVTGYTWPKEYRVFNDTLNKMEIDLKGSEKTANKIRTDGILNKSNTFACLIVSTDAPKANSSGAPKNISAGGFSLKEAANDYTKKGPIVKEIAKAGSGNTACDVVIADKDYIIVEDWSGR